MTNTRFIIFIIRTNKHLFLQQIITQSPNHWRIIEASAHRVGCDPTVHESSLSPPTRIQNPNLRWTVAGKHLERLHVLHMDIWKNMEEIWGKWLNMWCFLLLSTFLSEDSNPKFNLPTCVRIHDLQRAWKLNHGLVSSVLSLFESKTKAQWFQYNCTIQHSKAKVEATHHVSLHFRACQLWGEWHPWHQFGLTNPAKWRQDQSRLHTKALCPWKCANWLYKGRKLKTARGVALKCQSHSQCWLSSTQILETLETLRLHQFSISSIEDIHCKCPSFCWRCLCTSCHLGLLQYLQVCILRATEVLWITCTRQQWQG